MQERKVSFGAAGRMEVQCLLRGKGKDGVGKAGREVERFFLEEC